MSNRPSECLQEAAEIDQNIHSVSVPMSSNDHHAALTTCNTCRERYAAAARFCSHCGADNLGNDGDTDVTEDAAVTAKAHYDLFLLGIPVAATLALRLWVCNQSSAEAPQSLLLVSLLNVLGTAATACLEARAFGNRRHDQGSHHFDPPIWFALIALLWIVAYPLYLYRRKGYGAPNLLAVGVMLTIIFCGSAGMAAYRIDTQQQTQQAQQHLSNNATNTEARDHATEDPSIEAAIAAYQQARKYSGAVEICIKAKQVTALLRDANDLEHYRDWDGIQKADCHAAGLLEQ